MDEKNFEYIVALGTLFSLKKIGLLIVSFFLIYMVCKAVKAIAFRTLTHFPKQRIWILQTATLIIFFLTVFGGSFSIYYSLEPTEELSLALIGSIAVAVGLSLRELVSSLIAGTTIMMDPPFQVGDVIYYKDYCGEVVNIGLRAVRIRVDGDQIVTIPNSVFVNEAIRCQNPGKLYGSVKIEFYLHIRSDIDLCKKLLRELVCTSRYVYLEEPICINIEQKIQGDVLGLNFEVIAYIHDIKYSPDFKTELYERASHIFAEKNIQYAFRLGK